MKEELLFVYNEYAKGWALRKQLDRTFGVTEEDKPSVFLFRQQTNTSFDFINFKMDKDSLTVDKVRKFVSDFRAGTLTFEKHGQANVELKDSEEDYKEKSEDL